MDNTLKKRIKYWIKYLLSLWILCSCMPEFVMAQDMPTLKKSLSLAKVDSTRSRLLYELGMGYERTYPDSTFYFINQSLQLSKRSNDQNGIARAMYGLGYINMYYIKDETKALEWFNKCITVAKKTNNYLYLARSYHVLGIISEHQRIGNPFEIYNEALFFAKKSGDWRVADDIYSILSLYFYSQNKYKEAEKYIVLAMESSQKYDIDVWFSNGLDYCKLLLVQKKNTQAIAVAQKMKIAKSQLKKSKGEFVYLNDIGRLETILKNYSEAEKVYLKCLEIEKSKPKVDTFHLYFIFRNLEGLYVEQGEYKKAYGANKNLMEVMLWLKDKRQTQDSKLKMTKLKANLDIEKKEVEIALLETKQKQQRFFLIGVGILLFMLIAFLLFLQQNQQKIQSQKDKLSELNATKDKLFAILSHDLRSPVASLKNYLMLINWGALSQSEFADSTNRLNTQLSNVGNSLDNVLSWSISQMEGMKPKVEKVNVSEIIEEKISMLLHTQEAKQIKIQNQVLPIAEVMFDKNHFRIIIRNLLQNALKFTNFDGNIVFDFKKEGNTAIITISDDGLGIAEDKLKTLFELGKNESTLGTSQEQGTGLGLVLVKELVELNGGKLCVESVLGQGTTFSIKCSAA